MRSTRRKLRTPTTLIFVIADDTHRDEVEAEANLSIIAHGPGVRNPKPPCTSFADGRHEYKNGATNEFNKVRCERLSPNQSYHTQDGAANANLLNKIGGQGQAHGPDLPQVKMQSSQKEAALYYSRNNLKRPPGRNNAI